MACVGRIAEGEAAAMRDGRNRLKIEAWFAGSDVMIGKGGREFFERCWEGEGVRGVVDFSSEVCPEADHDSVLVDFKKGALERVFRRAAELATNRAS